MAVKDAYDQNIRRGDRVVGVRSKLRGECLGTGLRNTVLVKWDDGEEDSVPGKDLKLEKGRGL